MAQVGSSRPVKRLVSAGRQWIGSKQHLRRQTKVATFWSCFKGDVFIFTGGPNVNMREKEELRTMAKILAENLEGQSYRKLNLGRLQRHRKEGGQGQEFRFGP